MLYGFGHPGLDGVRPGFLDAPLQSLHREMNQAAADGQRVLTLLDDARSMRYLKSYNDSMSATFKGN